MILGVLQRLWARVLHKDKARLNDAVYAITHIRPKNSALYELAFQHSSLGPDKDSNERLEFLGDAVLSLVVGAYLFRKYPFKGEGFLTEVRSRIVKRDSLNTIARAAGIPHLLQYHGSLKRNPSAYGNALEALVGAVYLDHGYAKTAHFITHRIIHDFIDLEDVVATDSNHKSKLITWAQRNQHSIAFDVVTEERTPKGKVFTIVACVNNEPLGQASATNKKHAEQLAAQRAIASLTEQGLFQVPVLVT